MEVAHHFETHRLCAQLGSISLKLASVLGGNISNFKQVLQVIILNKLYLIL